MSSAKLQQNKMSAAVCSLFFEKKEWLFLLFHGIVVILKRELKQNAAV